MRAATLLWAAMAAVSGTGLFLLKYQVQAEERHLRELRKDIAGSEQAIHVLKAEWSYLNDPVRLREQAERHLGMRPMRPMQIVEISSIPMVGGPLYEPPGTLPVKKPVSTKPAAPAPHAAPTPAKPGDSAHPPAKPAGIGNGKVMTAKASAKPAAKSAPQVASAKVRP